MSGCYRKAEGRIRAQIERLDWLREKRPKRVKDVGAYLADAIRKDYAAPAGFEAETKRVERAAADQEREAEIRKAKARACADRDRVPGVLGGTLAG